MEKKPLHNIVVGTHPTFLSVLKLLGFDDSVPDFVRDAQFMLSGSRPVAILYTQDVSPAVVSALIKHPHHIKNYIDKRDKAFQTFEFKITDKDLHKNLGKILKKQSKNKLWSHPSDRYWEILNASSKNSTK
jgi:hypothetical protein